MPFDAAPVETCLTTKPWNVRKLIAWLRVTVCGKLVTCDLADWRPL